MNAELWKGRRAASKLTLGPRLWPISAPLSVTGRNTPPTPMRLSHRPAKSSIAAGAEWSTSKMCVTSMAHQRPG